MKTIHRNSTEAVMERATGIEPATFNLGIKTIGPLFSPLTKPLRKNQRACIA